MVIGALYDPVGSAGNTNVLRNGSLSEISPRPISGTSRYRVCFGYREDISPGFYTSGDRSAPQAVNIEFGTALNMCDVTRVWNQTIEGRRLLEFLYLNILEAKRISMILKDNVSVVLGAKALPFVELTFGNFLGPIFATNLGLGNLRSVQPVF